MKVRQHRTASETGADCSRASRGLCLFPVVAGGGLRLGQPRHSVAARSTPSSGGGPDANPQFHTRPQILATGCVITPALSSFP
jgi:hypothetical protein